MLYLMELEGSLQEYRGWLHGWAVSRPDALCKKDVKVLAPPQLRPENGDVAGVWTVYAKLIKAAPTNRLSEALDEITSRIVHRGRGCDLVVLGAWDHFVEPAEIGVITVTSRFTCFFR